MSDLTLSDPTFIKNPNPGWFDRQAIKWINDERDLPFVRLSAKLLALYIPAAFFFFFSKNISWIWAALYWGLTFGVFLGPYILMLHNISHRPLFKKQYESFKLLIVWVLGPFFGETPETYYGHHIGMHHPENNLAQDLSSTLRFQRDSFLDFCLYLFRFLAFGIFELTHYLWSHRRQKLARRTLMGESLYFVGVTILLFINWKATLIVFIVPLLFARFAMMSGNWAQHAFIDASQPESPFGNSIAVINSRYNRTCFNDGYHIGHHVKANRHWTEMPADFLNNLDTYRREKAVVFQKIDYFVIWLFLMLKRYDWLAKFYVDLGEKKRTREEIAAYLKERTRALHAFSPSQELA